MDDRPCGCEAAPSAKAGSLAGLIPATGRAARATSRTTLPFVDRGKEATDRYGVPWRAPATRKLAAVHATVIDGERWAAERLLFLAGRLAGDPSENERQALEAEIEALSKERGIGFGGLPAPRVGRRRRRKG